MIAVALAAGCAGGSPRTTSAPLPHDAWSSRTMEQKLDVMKHAVLPEMGALFQRFYNEPDVKLTCQGCHGENAEQVGWRMPNELPKLDPKRMPDRNEDVAKFMYDQVTPKMQQLLGVGPYDPKSGSGLGCFTCHPAKKS